MQKAAEIIEIKKNQIRGNTTVNSYTVNSKSKSLSTVNSKEVADQPKTLEEDIAEAMRKHNLPKEGAAMYIAELLNDTKSIKLYKILVSENKPEFLMERAHYVKEMDLQGKIWTHNRPAYYLGLLRRLGVKVKFKKIA